MLAQRHGGGLGWGTSRRTNIYHVDQLLFYPSLGSAVSLLKFWISFCPHEGSGLDGQVSERLLQSQPAVGFVLPVKAALPLPSDANCRLASGKPCDIQTALP
jgi:hypothetical protein